MPGLRRFAVLSLLLLFVPAAARALDVPPATGYVNDRAGMLSQGTDLKLDRFLRNFEKTDSTQIVVLTVPSLEGEPLEDYSIQVAQAWGIGQKGKDNGALLLIAKKEHKIRIEVGYGLEGRLTDLISGRIVDNVIEPRFKAGDFDGGVVAGVAPLFCSLADLSRRRPARPAAPYRLLDRRTALRRRRGRLRRWRLFRRWRRLRRRRCLGRMVTGWQVRPRSIRRICPIGLLRLIRCGPKQFSSNRFQPKVL
jgi:uncharacterized membrane protein YgcG